MDQSLTKLVWNLNVPSRESLYLYCDNYHARKRYRPSIVFFHMLTTSGVLLVSCKKHMSAWGLRIPRTFRDTSLKLIFLHTILRGRKEYRPHTCHTANWNGKELVFVSKKKTHILQINFNFSAGVLDNTDIFKPRKPVLPEFEFPAKP